MTRLSHPKWPRLTPGVRKTYDPSAGSQTLLQARNLEHGSDVKHSWEKGFKSCASSSTTGRTVALPFGAGTREGPCSAEQAAWCNSSPTQAWLVYYSAAVASIGETGD